MDNNGSGGSDTITPCAACKLLKRRCAQDCFFSAYFSPQETHKFKSVDSVFGASNFSNILMEVPESQRAEAAKSLIYEASLRVRDPVHGSMGVISSLQRQIDSAQAKLNTVRAQILKYRDQADITRSPDDGLLQPNSAASTVALTLMPPSMLPHLHPSLPSSFSSSMLSRPSLPSQK